MATPTQGITVEQREHLLRQIARIRLAGSEFAGEFWSTGSPDGPRMNELAFSSLEDVTEIMENIVKRQPIRKD
jgi:hypothetical protein